jgi:hypothetical protein
MQPWFRMISDKAAPFLWSFCFSFHNHVMTQKTLQFERRNPLQSATLLARTIALPHECKPLRYPSFPALERTSVLGFNAPVSVNVIAPGIRALLCRQASYPLWCDYSSTVPFFYQATYVSGAKQNTSYVVEGLQGELERADASTVSATVSIVGVSGSITPLVFPTPPPSVHPIIGRDGQFTYIYIPDGCSMTLVGWIDGVVFGTGQTGRVVINQWMGPGEERWAASIDSTPAVSNERALVWLKPITAGGWYRVDQLIIPASGTAVGSMYYTMVVTNSPGDTVIQSIITLPTVVIGSTVTSRSLLPTNPPPEFNSSTIPYCATRLTAVGALFTNVTKALNKEGSVLAGRLNPVRTNPFNFGSGDLVNLHPSEKAYLGLEHGHYTYAPPSSDMVDFQDYTIEPRNSAQIPCYRLDNTSLVNAMLFSDPDGATSLAVNLDIHLEFRNTSALFPVGMSAMTLESFHQAQLSLAEFGYFFHNEDHVTVFKLLKPILSHLVDYMPYGPQIKKAAAIGAKVYKTGQMIMNTRIPKTIVPTRLNVQTSPPPSRKSKRVKRRR